MEYISSFIYCDNITIEMTQHGPVHRIMNPIQVLNPIALPSNYSFAIACNIAGLELEAEYKLRIVFSGPDGEILKDTNDIPVKLPKVGDKEKKGFMQFNLDFRNVVLRKADLYTTKVYINGKLFGEYKIDVIASGKNGNKST